MAKKGEIDIEIKAQELGLSLENLATSVEAEFKAAIGDIANGAYAKIIAEAQEKLSSTRQDYLKGLDFVRIGNNTYLITLDGKFSSALERGWGPYDQRETLLKSNKVVSVGSRAGLPWVKTAKKGHRYAHVPLRRTPFTKEPKYVDMAQMLRQVETRNAMGRKQKLTSLFKDPSGKALIGKVANVTDLGGITKYQQLYKNERTGKEKVESIYISYRTISEIGQGWQNRGFSGLQAFEHAEQWINSELEKILQYFLG